MSVGAETAVRGAAMTPSIARLASWLGVRLCLAPLLVLTVPRWTNAILFAGVLLSGALLLSGRLPPLRLARTERRLAALLLVTLVSPIVATVAAALLRGDLYPAQFEAPSRFLLAVPLFLFVLRWRVPAGRILQWVLPVALLLALAYLHFIGQDPRWPARRVTTHAVDPLVFCYLTLTFGLMGLVSITPRDWREGDRWSVALRFAAFFLGAYLSLLTFSRTGWAAVPLLVAAWLLHHWGGRGKLQTFTVLGLAVLAPVAAYLLVPVIADRVDITVREILSYPWQGVAPETSVGLRITYLRMAADLFAQHPWAGVGDTARMAPATVADFPYASPFAVQSAFESAFHNQVVSSAVRSGAGGLVSAALLLLVPLAICLRAVRQPENRGNADAAMGVAFFTTLVVSSLSTEVVDLKFMASFYATMTALFCGVLLNRHGQD
ncbi:MAG TPA: O-antigen ligase family protein [Ramlibacter sp.]